MNDHDLIIEIQRLLSGTEWTADTLADIAALLEEAGYEIEEIR